MGFETFILPIALIAGGIFLVYEFFLNKKPNEFKRIDLRKKIKDDMSELYDIYAVPVGKVFTNGLTDYKYVKGYMSLFYDETNLTHFKDNAVKEQARKENPKLKEMLLLKVCGLSSMSKLLSNFGFGTKYILVDKEMLKFTSDSVIIDNLARPDLFFGIPIYSKADKEYIENISWIVNRENELEEIANFIPKGTYLEFSMAKEKATSDLLEDINKVKRDEQLEKIKKER